MPFFRCEAGVAEPVRALLERLCTEYAAGGLAAPGLLQAYLAALLCELNRVYLVLLGVAVPLKPLYANPTFVRTLGPIHGLLFLLFIIKTLSVGVEQRWKFSETPPGKCCWPVWCHSVHSTSIAGF